MYLEVTLYAMVLQVTYTRLNGEIQIQIRIYVDPLFWMKYHYTDELWSPHAFYGRLGKYTSTKLFTYEYVGRWFVDSKLEDWN